MNAFSASVALDPAGTLQNRLDRLWIGDTADAVAQFLNVVRAPRQVDGVEFLWRRPDLLEFTTPGIPDAGTPAPFWRSKWEVDQAGRWAVRAMSAEPAVKLDWFFFDVFAGPGDEIAPAGAMWVSGGGSALTTGTGGVFSAVRIDKLSASEALAAGGKLPYVTPEGETKALPGQAVLDAATEVVQPIAEEVGWDAQAVEQSRQEVEAALAQALALLSPSTIAGALGLPITDFTDPRNSALLTVI
jgi:hypothetical protein